MTSADYLYIPVSLDPSLGPSYDSLDTVNILVDLSNNSFLNQENMAKKRKILWKICFLIVQNRGIRVGSFRTSSFALCSREPFRIAEIPDAANWIQQNKPEVVDRKFPE